ncbi:HAMP domain-containing sensor histidine kinase [Actinocrispum wychmicini]|uniref:histidine kinase n=1 Tax=Actinocrispum wychmicini TaxID=1213861 RepID=A0A4R2JLZ8_9PSEU|nr:HAMP domain-containing sensor histidine kinase [Actinocrispum wychmicini]TCO59632.1 two-component system OmpR family sensor kinase [Actinocrispum wychmicini]
MTGGLPSRLIGKLSLRARLLLLTVGLFAIGLLVSNAVVVASLRTPLVDRVDNQLRTTGNLVTKVPPSFLESVHQGALTIDLVSDLYVAYLSPTGHLDDVMRAGAHADAPGPDLPALDSAAVALRAGKPFETSSADGTGWRVLTLPRSANDGTSVVVAALLTEVNSTVDRVQASGLAIRLLVLGLLAVLGFFAVTAGLRPLRRIEETSAAIAGGNLASRIPDTAAPNTEIGRLSTALNGMLARIEAAIAAQAASEAKVRRFVSDASHELRTPLSGIKGFAELYRMGALPERADVDRTMDRIERESGRLSRLVDDLLLLAQLDEAAGPTGLGLRLAPMDLRSLAVDALHDLRALDPSRHVELTGPGSEPMSAAPTIGDEERLRQVVSNLIGNAVAHTPVGSPVRIGVGVVAGHAILEVADAGPGLTGEQAKRVFERFYRTDASRSRGAGGGAGLGLAIAESLASAHGGSIHVSGTPGGGATFSLALPIHTDLGT